MPRSFELIAPPEIVRRSTREDTGERRISNMITPWDGEPEIDVGLLMVPYSRTAARGTNCSAAAPNALREAFSYHTSYSPDFDVDLRNLRIADLGDVRTHPYDAALSHSNIEDAVVEVYEALNDVMLVSIGGDHSVTRFLVQGYCRAHPGEKVGLVHFDAHYDVRPFEDGGPNAGTPIRGILEGKSNVDGKNVVQLGIHGFMSAYEFKQYSESKGATVVTAREVRRRGILDVMEQAIEIVSDGTDSIYVTYDVDSMSSAWAPGCGNSTPEGLEPWDVLEAMYILGEHPKVKALDVVCIDPFRDVRMITARMGVSVILTFLGGYVVRSTGTRGY